ncbi:MAG TPA: hypothetical protein VLU73_10575, partial [Methylococcaceae bacterium]|nr:hypothetical protein [Methylococcaceae bacterium]
LKNPTTQLQFIVVELEHFTALSNPVKTILSRRHSLATPNPPHPNHPPISPAEALREEHTILHN